MEMNEIREAICDFLGILKHKAETGRLTPQDLRAILEAIMAGGGIQATVDDLAGYYQQSPDNIRHLINRSIMPAPQRRVYHDFDTFRRRVPAKWKNGRLKSKH